MWHCTPVEGLRSSSFHVCIAVWQGKCRWVLFPGLSHLWLCMPAFMLGIWQEKLKDKKATLVNAIKEALQVFYKSGCLTFPDLWEGTTHTGTHPALLAILLESSMAQLPAEP